MSNTFKIALAGAAVLAIAVIGVALSPSRTGELVGSPGASPSPTAAPTPWRTPVEASGVAIEVRRPDAQAARSALPVLQATTNALVVTTRPEVPIGEWNEPWGEWLREGNVMTFVDVDRRGVVERQLPELVFGSTSLHERQLLASDRLVFFGATEIYAMDADPAAEPEAILPMSMAPEPDAAGGSVSDTFITPSGVPGRMWVSLPSLDGPEGPRQLLQINTRGEVLSRAEWGGYNVGVGLPSLVVSHKQVWDPVAYRVVLHLPGDEFDSNQVVAGSDRNRFTWCEGGFPCQVLHLTDLDAGGTRIIAEFPDGDPRFRPEGLSPEGRYLAATICVDDDRLCALAVLDLDANRSWTVAQGWVGLAGITGGSTTPAWSPDGRWVFFQLNDGRLAAYRPGDTEAQVVDVPALDPAIGFAVVSAPHRSE